MAKWGTFIWKSGAGATKWSRGLRPFDYRVVMLDRQGIVQTIFRDNVETIDWEYKRVGGCGDMSIVIRDRFDDYEAIEADYEIQIWIIPPTGSNYQLVYSGYVQEKIPALQDGENITVRCVGYSAQLDRAVVRREDDNPYNNIQISANDDVTDAIVNDIIKNYVAPITDIVYDETLIDTALDPVTSLPYAPDEFKGGDSAEKLIKELAGLAGNFEWGVGTDKKFFFKQKSTDRDHNFIVGGEVSRFRPQESYSKIKNRVILKVKGENVVFALEREDDLAMDQEQSNEAGGWVNLGTNASQKLKQKFLPNKQSFSKVSLKAQYVGFTELMTDGDMEEYTTAAWEIDGATTFAGKSSNPSFDGLSMKCITIFPGLAPTRLDPPLEGYGFKQSLSNMPNENYVLSFRYYLTMGDMFCQVWDKTNEASLVDTERFTNQKTWTRMSIGFSIGGYYATPGPLDIEIRFYSCLQGVSTFRIDNVSLKAARDGVKVSVREDDLDNEISSFVLDQPDWTGTISLWLMKYPLDRTKVHDIVLERTRAIAGYGFSDSNYYQVKKSA